jgi:hypothetical protein
MAPDRERATAPGWHGDHAASRDVGACEPGGHYSGASWGARPLGAVPVAEQCGKSA